jgi:lipoprotein-anchoring transpeptidase ErfK/SrfK
MRKYSAVFVSILGIALIFSEAAQAQSLLPLLFGGRSGTAMQQDPFAPIQPGPSMSAPMQPAPVQPQEPLQATLGGGGTVLYPEMVSRSRVVPGEFRRQTVFFRTDEKPGTIVIDAGRHFLYYVLGGGQAIRYGVGVGRTGFGWKGIVTVASKQEWPAWHPPKEMIAREAQRGHRLPAKMEGGPGNPLGARALYLHDGGRDTGYRIHGTSEPWTIGLNVSSGCIRLVNDDVIDLYQRVDIGTKVVVL